MPKISGNQRPTGMVVHDNLNQVLDLERKQNHAFHKLEQFLKRKQVITNENSQLLFGIEVHDILTEHCKK